MYLLAQHPEWQERIRREVWGVCGRPTQPVEQPGDTEKGLASGPSCSSDYRAPTYDDIAALPELGWVVNETLRLYPPAAQIARSGEGAASVRDHAASSVRTIASLRIVPL
jgi:cytochrome P450